ncbi:unnamed protein product [Ilex paraguariensis]|uniref:Ionotropic glutamate receptor C-terminal domain-containing protein n=1 Tax=Ilex paraguariensis TaxID=185542 RepID=A0ABC8QRI4_9AQUA
MAERYKYAEFSQPYIESGLVMVVTVKPDIQKERFLFMKAFKTKMWVLMAIISIATGCVIWLIEHVNNNPEYEGSFPHQIGEMLWFSMTVLSFSQRESIKSNLSRVVLATWFFVIVIVSACFTAVLSSMMTVQRLQPSVIDIEYLQTTNAAVGCNGNSFIVRYLVNVLHFKPENIKSINSINDYPEAFQRGEIKAAFFVDPHAKVFFAKYCDGYTRAGASFKLGGFGFVFPKGSPLATDISEAILKVTESGEINTLEKHMLSFSNCSSSVGISDDPSLDYEPFSGLFIVSGGISAAALLITIARLLDRHRPITGFIQTSLINRRVCSWASLLLIQCYSRFGFQFFRESFIRRANDQMNVPDAQEGNLIGIELARNHDI